MNKAKYLRKEYGTGYDRNMVYLFYEYRGIEYEVYENRGKGNITLAWQHRNAQTEIDNYLDGEKKQKISDARPVDMDEVFRLMGWD